MGRAGATSVDTNHSTNSNGQGEPDSEAGETGVRPKAKRVVVNKYTRHACNQCKKAKTRCEGKPICNRCLKTGHDCIWVEDNRKALTRHHEQALRHQNGVLRTEVETLKRELEQLKVHQHTTEISSPSSAHPRSPISLTQHVMTSSMISSEMANVDLNAQISVSHSGLLSPSSATRSSGPTLSMSDAEQVMVSSSSESSKRVQNTFQKGGREVSSSSSSYVSILPTPGASGSNSSFIAHPALHTAYPDIRMSVSTGGGMDDRSLGDDALGQAPYGVYPNANKRVDREMVGYGVDGGGEEDDDWSDGASGGSDTSMDDGDSAGDSYDSDSDVDKALIAPTKTLFIEYDDLHLYGLTSVFRLRRRASQHTVRSARLSASSRSSSRHRSSYYSSRGHYTPSHTSSRSRANSSAGSTKTSVRGVRRRDSYDSSRSKGKSDHDGRNRTKSRGKGKYREKRTLARSRSPLRTARHILLVGEHDGENTSKGCECQSECWSRWLPKGVPLTRSEHDMDMYTFLHPSTSLSRPSTPSHPSQHASPRLPHYSPFLHNTLLAVATAFSDDPEVRKMEVRVKFAEEAKGYIETECSRPSISAVQALSMLASFYSGQGQQTLGFMYFGMSARIAQALGLGADCTPLLRSGRLRHAQLFDRAWCFHMGCAQDACWSLYVGRDFGIPLGNGPSDDPASLLDVYEGMSERLDRMCWRRAHIAENSAKAITDAEPEDATSVEEHQTDMNFPQCRTFTVFLWSCQLMKISRRIMDLMNRLATSDGGTEIKLLVADIDIQLIAWREDLPPELKLMPSNEGSALPHKLMMHLAYWWLLILLHRPFYQRQRIKTVDLSFSVGRCNLAAREILSTLRLWRKIYGTVRFAPITLVQTAFASGTIYILQAMQASMGRRPATVAQATALDNVQEIVGVLREIEQSWECAGRIADIFEKLLKDQRKAMESGVPYRRSGKRKRRKAVATEPSASAQASADIHAAVPSNQGATSITVDPRMNENRTGDASLPVQPHAYPVNAEASAQTAMPDSTSFPYFFEFEQTHPPTVQFAEPLSSVIESHATRGVSHSSEHNLGYDFSSISGQISDDSSDSQYTGPINYDHPMSNSESFEGLDGFETDDLQNLNFLYNVEIDMDSIMPGLGMFDPTGLGGINEMGLGLGMGLNNMGTMGTGAGFGFSEVDASALNMHSYATYPTRTELPQSNEDSDAGTYNPYSEMDFTSDGEDRALYDVIATLHNEQAHRR